MPAPRVRERAPALAREAARALARDGVRTLARQRAVPLTGEALA
ncbi:MAG: hypothetical protein ACR2MP_11145 [Streptosporangiaceae bacterium]